jgi:Uma2 family endonuclease
MGRAEPLPEKLTQAEYLARERAAEFKSEYYKGEIFAMSGVRRQHVAIVSNVVAGLKAKLKKRGCDIWPNDMRVHVRQNTLYTYPDLVVFCGEPEFLDGEFDTLMNPTAIIEVLSESTRDYDSGTKFSLYRGIPTLGEYILIDSQQRQIERWYRADGTWHLDPNTTEQITVAECSIGADEVYESVNFAA